MIENILKHGTQIQKKRALKALTMSAQFRGRRQALMNISFPLPRILQPLKHRLIYHAGFKESIRGRLVRKEGEGPSGDPAIDEAYDGAGHTWDLYYDVFGRNSVDNKGMHLVSLVHYGKGYDNAFWDGEKMVYGDGDEDLPEEERIFRRFTIAVDIIGHELTHGVTQYEARLEYHGQSGALNESFSDIFGSLVKQRVLNHTATEADWLIGQGIFTSNVNGKAIRSMKSPGTAYDDPLLGKDPQPGHMADYIKTTSDNGGVHLNSGIPSRAFYICADEIGGYAWEKAGQIWYRALCGRLSAGTDFQEAADIIFRIAGEEYGNGSKEQDAVKKGWEEVGISIRSDKKKSI
ncbi:MAG: M4 family metallopeptidase [Bacteroidales bacterium]|nr:M4 family metallopeptidase [Bacteroidales bacterium]